MYRHGAAAAGRYSYATLGREGSRCRRRLPLGFHKRSQGAHLASARANPPVALRCPRPSRLTPQRTGVGRVRGCWYCICHLGSGGLLSAGAGCHRGFHKRSQGAHLASARANSPVALRCLGPSRLAPQRTGVGRVRGGRPRLAVGLMGMPMWPMAAVQAVDFVVLAWPTPDAVAPPFTMTKRPRDSRAVRTNARPLNIAGSTRPAVARRPYRRRVAFAKTPPVQTLSLIHI